MINNNLSFSNPSELFDPTPYGFCHTVKVPSNGELVYISGQSGGEGINHILNEDFRHQVKALLKNLEIALKSHELRFSDVMKITILIVDHNLEKLSIWGEEMNKYWTANALPASTLIPVSTLALEYMQVEVEAIAFKSA
ncbi:RidA family protein [Vibrio splendidus]|nr:RidA family protein [Vibrio splendidus]